MYSHCIFLFLIIIINQLNCIFSGVALDTEKSFVLSLDSLSTLSIYFSPKIHDARISGRSNQIPVNQSVFDTATCNHCESCTCVYYKDTTVTEGTKQAYHKDRNRIERGDQAAVIVFTASGWRGRCCTARPLWADGRGLGRGGRWWWENNRQSLRKRWAARRISNGRANKVGNER